MLHALPSLTGIVACSNEGAGLAAGIALLIYWGVVTIVVTVVIAIASGVVVGMRKGRTGRQVLIHLGWAGVFLVLLPFAAAILITFTLAYESWRLAGATADLDAWLAPLRQPTAGQFDRAIESVMNAKGADTLERRLQLIAVLPYELEKIEITLNERERAALAAAALQLRTENVERKLGSHPSNLERLDGAVAWFTERPNLAAALRACAGRRQCITEVLDAADRWCWQHRDGCRAGITAAHIAEASALFQRTDEDTLLKLKGIGRNADIK